MKPQLFITILLLIVSINVASADVGVVYDAHIAWKTAFEKADIAAVSEIWSHAADTTLITLGGKKKNGFKEIQAELFLSFQLTGETEIDESNLLITLSPLREGRLGDKASATSDYRWSPLPNVPLKTTELYRKENGGWKMIAQDGTGKVLPPLRPDDEIRVREQVQQANDALAGADIDKLAALTADNDFTYVALNGTVHQKLDEVVIGADLEKIRKVLLEVIYLIDDVATAHLTLTLTGNNERNVQFAIKDFQLTKLNFAPKSLVVRPKGKLTTIWARIKTQTPG